MRVQIIYDAQEIYYMSDIHIVYFMHNSLFFNYILGVIGNQWSDFMPGDHPAQGFAWSADNTNFPAQIEEEVVAVKFYY